MRLNYTALEVERTDSIVTITLNRPERKNAMDAGMIVELGAVFTEVAATPADRVVVLTGAGVDFCSGADLGSARPDGMHILPWMRVIGETVGALHRIPQPVIAKVRGVAVGAGANLALGCDLVVAGEDARFSQIFAKRGLSVDFGGSYLLPRLVGTRRAKELAFFAEMLPAREAEAVGLVNRVVPVESLDSFVLGWATQLAEGPPLALASTKRLLDEGSSSSMEQALEAEALAQSVNFSTADASEAFKAFRERRTPTFQGR